MPFILPYQYDESTFQPDSFEDITAKNLQALARAFGVTQQLRILHGMVSSSGAFVSGTAGWSSSQTGTGLYAITFDRAFGEPPSFALGPVTGTATVLATASSADVSTYNIGGAAANHSFSFIAVL